MVFLKENRHGALENYISLIANLLLEWPGCSNLHVKFFLCIDLKEVEASCTNICPEVSISKFISAFS